MLKIMTKEILMEKLKSLMLDSKTGEEKVAILTEIVDGYTEGTTDDLVKQFFNAGLETEEPTETVTETEEVEEDEEKDETKIEDLFEEGVE